MVSVVRARYLEPLPNARSTESILLAPKLRIKTVPLAPEGDLAGVCRLWQSARQVLALSPPQLAHRHNLRRCPTMGHVTMAASVSTRAAPVRLGTGAMESAKAHTVPLTLPKLGQLPPRPVARSERASE